MLDRETMFRSAVASQPAFVFENDPAMAESCAALIRELKLKVDVTSDIAEALQLARTKEYCFAIVRLQPQSPQSGLEIAKTIRAKCATTHLLLIASSWPSDILSQTMKLARTVVIEVPPDHQRFQELIRRSVVTWSGKARSGVAETLAAPSGSPAPASPAPARAATPVNAPPPPASNRRNQVRFEILDSQVEVYEKKWVTLPFGRGVNRGRRLVDLSTGGCCLICTEPLDPPVKIRIRIHVKKFNDQIELVGEIRWCRANGKNIGEFLVGAMFEAPTPEQIRRLKTIEGVFTSKARPPTVPRPNA